METPAEIVHGFAVEQSLYLNIVKIGGKLANPAGDCRQFYDHFWFYHYILNAVSNFTVSPLQ